jgi:hypothetical protein
MSAGGDPAFIDEVLRVHARYAGEVVEAFNICPFARHARLAGRVAHRVLLQRDDALSETLAILEELVAEPPTLEIAQLIYPNLAITPRELDWFLHRVREAEAARRPGEPVFVMAAFHPDGPLDARSPERLVAFLRRTPDPTLQLLRFARLQQMRDDAAHGTAFLDVRSLSLEELLAAPPPPLGLAERIARDNHAMAQRVGLARLEAVLADIRTDRDRSYARFR